MNAPQNTPYAANLRVGFPSEAVSTNSESLVYEYIGLDSEFEKPAEGEIWGEAPWHVDSAYIERFGNLGGVIMRVIVSVRLDDGQQEKKGVPTETADELEWVPIRRPLFEHPKFAAGGTNALTFADLNAIEFWKNETDYALRAAYKFRDSSGTETTLSANAQRYVRYLVRNVDSYDDYAPIARRNKTYEGGPPADGAAAGTKTDLFSGFAGGAPSGTWEWVKSADRRLRSGRKNWQRAEELTGATKVLVDSQNLYLE